MDGVQLPQGYSHFEEAVYFLPFSSQNFLVLNLSTSEGWKAESTLEPPSGFEHGTPGLVIQRLNRSISKIYTQSLLNIQNHFVFEKMVGLVSWSLTRKEFFNFLHFSYWLRNMSFKAQTWYSSFRICYIYLDEFCWIRDWLFWSSVRSSCKRSSCPFSLFTWCYD